MGPCVLWEVPQMPWVGFSWTGFSFYREMVEEVERFVVEGNRDLGLEWRGE